MNNMNNSRAERIALLAALYRIADAETQALVLDNLSKGDATKKQALAAAFAGSHPDDGHQDDQDE